MKSANALGILVITAVALIVLAYLAAVTLNGVLGDTGFFGSGDDKGMAEHQFIVMEPAGTPWWVFYFTIVRPTAYVSLLVAVLWSAKLVIAWASRSIKDASGQSRSE